MWSGNIQRKILKLSMIITLIVSLLIFVSGLLVLFFFPFLVEFYIDGVVKNLNITKELIIYYESITPSKDDLPEEIDLGRLPWYAALFLSGLGVNMAAFSSFGILASVSRKPDYILILIVLMIAGLICQFFLFASLIDLNSTVNTDAMEELVKALQTRYEVGARSNSTFTFFMNSVMLLGECCGVSGPGDFLRMGTLNFTYEVDDKTYIIPTYFPPACCKRSFIEEGFHSTTACIKSRDLEHINNKGCYEKTYIFIRNNYGVLVIWIFTLLMFWEVLQILISLVILCAPAKVEKQAIQQVLKAAELQDLNEYTFLESSSSSTVQESAQILARKPVFVPYVKIPSSESVGSPASQIW